MPQAVKSATVTTVDAMPTARPAMKRDAQEIAPKPDACGIDNAPVAQWYTWRCSAHVGSS